jgi:phosphopantothenoylcysteine decarboxylase/phosphopantothenate--cysteine ligase
VGASGERSRVLLGVTGGIAAYKSPELVRRLRDAGCEVRCALTPSAAAFVAPLALEIVSGAPVYDERYLTPGGDGDEAHITAAAWADLLLVAPATAHTLASLALGLADNFLLTTALAFRGPLIVAPAMHAAMWEQRATAARLGELRARGVEIVGPTVGALASGEVAIGRMAEVADLVAAVRARLRPGRLAGRTVLVTAGPTFEPIDPVRYLGNRSSGKMGFALAAAAARQGATVRLVAGPVALATPPGVERHDVESAREMEAAVRRLAPGADVVVMAAAVADFRPAAEAPQKLKKRDGAPDLALVPNPDILALLPEIAPAALRVGFAAETSEVVAEAERKLAAKGAHLLVANDVSRPGIGFASDDNEVTVLRRGAEPLPLAKASKTRLAERLIEIFAGELDRLRGDRDEAAG